MRHLLLIIALALFGPACKASGQGNEQPNDTAKSASQAAVEYRIKEVHPPINEVTIGADHTPRRDSNQTKAQPHQGKSEQASEWTGPNAIAAYCAIFAAGVSVFSFGVAWRSYRASRESARIAKLSLQHAKATTELQLRGFLHILDIQSAKEGFVFIDRYPNDLRINLANYGATPVEITSISQQIEQEPSMAESFTSMIAGNKRIMRAQSEAAFNIPLPQPPVIPDNVTTLRFKLIVSIAYQDVFKVDRVTTEAFTFSYIPNQSFTIDLSAKERQHT